MSLNEFFSLTGPWAGVGSRDTPVEVLELMARYARTAYDLRLGPLHSGDAIGADFAFWVGAKLSDRFPELKAKIFLSRNGFGNRWVDQEGIFINAKTLPEAIYTQARDIAYNARGGFYGLGVGGQQLMTRNAFQILSEDLITPVSKMLYYAPPQGNTEKVRGGTNCALQIAIRYDVPRLNLFYEANQTALIEWLAIHESTVRYPDNLMAIIDSRTTNQPLPGF